MATAIIVLLVVAALVALSIARPARPSLTPAPLDRDRERVLADLRALPDYRNDVRIP